MWSYSLGLQQGWFPANPRDSIGVCAKQGFSNPFEGPLRPSQTGGVGAGTIAPTFASIYSQWPPLSLANIPNAAVLPTYTPTGAVPTLPPATYTLKNGATTVGGNGWANSADNAGAPVSIAGCTYPDAWAQTTLPVPTGPCPTQADRRRAPLPKITGSPRS